MVVAGVMSGTSADGIDVALVRIRPGEPVPRVRVLGHRSFAYARPVRQAVLAAMDAPAIAVAELSRLHWRLGALYAEAIATTCAELGVDADLVGLHGQTIYHQATDARYLGKAVRSTWQLGEAAVVAERLRVPVVSDFRPNDLAAGGQGAPLVPMLDMCLFQSQTQNRVLLNLGGIANLTALPAGGAGTNLLAFDTGPGNMVMDALMQQHFRRGYDRGGKVAGRGAIVDKVVATCLRDAWFAAPPPKSCGREQFGAAYVGQLQRLCRGSSAADMVATATELTAAAVLDASRRFVLPHLSREAPLAKGTQLLISGGGVCNATLVARLMKGFADLGVTTLSIESLGIDPQAKEAVAFALLAWLRWYGLPGNVPAATGAARAVPLGKVTFA